MNEEMLLEGIEDELELEGLDEEDLEGLEDNGLEGEGLAAAVRRRARLLRTKMLKTSGRAPQPKAKLVSPELVKSIREIIKTDFYDVVYYDGVSETIPFFVDPIGKKHTVYRNGGSKTEYAKTQAETNIRKPNELELAQQVKVLGVSLAIYTRTVKPDSGGNVVSPKEAYEIVGDTLFRIKIGETERFAVPTRHIPSGSDLYGDEIVTRGLPGEKNYYSFGKNTIIIKVGETFRPEIIFQQNITASERAKLEGLKLTLRFHTIFARPVA